MTTGRLTRDSGKDPAWVRRIGPESQPFLMESTVHPEVLQLAGLAQDWGLLEVACCLWTCFQAGHLAPALLFICHPGKARSGWGEGFAGKVPCRHEDPGVTPGHMSRLNVVRTLVAPVLRR